MNILSLHGLLLSLGVQGLLWTLLLLALCFGGVYVAELARLGWEYKNSTEKTEPKNEKQKEESKAPAPKAQEPIYYIVEKKKRRPKNGYTKPKPFHFKED